MCKKTVCFLLWLAFNFVGCTFHKVAGEANYSVQSPSAIETTRTIKIEENRNKNLGEELIWQGQVDRFFLKWTTTDIYISQSSPNEKVVAFSDFAKKKAKTDTEITYSVFPKNKGEKSYLGMNAQIKSIVGNLVSFEIGYVSGGGGGASSSVNTQLVIVDFGKDSVFDDLDKAINKALELNDDYLKMDFPLSLKDYFSDEELLASLLQNSTIKQSLGKNNVETPKSVDELIGSGIIIGVDKYQANIFLVKESLSNFMFDRIEKDKIVAKLQVFTQETKVHEALLIEIKLPVNKKINDRLSLPNTLFFKNGFELYEDKFAEIAIESKLGEAN